MNTYLGEGLNGAKGGLAYTVDICCYYIVSLIAIIIISIGSLSGTDGAIYISFLVSPLAICATLVATFKVGKLSFKEVYPLKCKPKYYLIALMLIFGLLFSVSRLNVLFLEFLQSFGYEQKLTESTIPNLDGINLLPAILVIAVLPAFLEEGLFRGVILQGAENSFGSVGAIFVVGALFALFHGSAEQTIYQFICGCMFAFLVIRSRSILPAVLIHFLNNGLILALTSLNLLDDGGNLIVSSQGDLAITIASGLCFVGALVWLILDKTPLKKCNKAECIRFWVYAALGIIIMIATVIAGLFI